MSSVGLGGSGTAVKTRGTSGRRWALWAATSASLLMGCGDIPVEGDVTEVRSALGLTSYGKKALLITDLSVIRDTLRTSDPCDATSAAADYPWTISHMLKVAAAAQGKTTDAYVKNWLDNWSASTTINGQTFSLSNASGPLVRAAWPKDAQGKYIMHKAPFKLLAIVSRFDLRNVRPSGEPLGGEIRFVFAPQYDTSAGPSPDTRCITRSDGGSSIILEYSPAKADENAILAVAKRWHALGSMAFGGTYRSELAKLTEELLLGTSTTTPPTPPGRLLRIRTNESPGGVSWTFTEFEHDPTSKFLVRSTIKRSPTEALHIGKSLVLGLWMMDNKDAILGTKPVGRTFFGIPVANYFMPNTVPGDPNTYLRGAFNVLDSNVNPNFWWDATNPGVSQSEWPDVRHLFSLATCSGCHGRETDTTLLHIHNSDSGTALLSNFLSGPITVADPVTGQNRQFDEMGRREEDLKALVTDGPVGVPVVKNTYTGGNSATTNYKMVFWHSNKCLDLSGVSQSDNAAVQQYACHGDSNQRLALVNKGPGAYNLVFKHSGKCLDVENGSTSNGAKVVQKTCSSATSQRISMWYSSPGPGGRILKFEHSGKCLRVKDNSLSDAASVIQETCADSSPNDRSFKFIE